MTVILNRSRSEELAKAIYNNNNISFDSTASLNHAVDGCIILGKDSNRGNRYVTRFKINRSEQRRGLRSSEVVRDACCPCCNPEKRQRWNQFLWQVVRAEGFLITLHIGVIILGAVKEAMDYRDFAEELELAHSILELIITLLLVLLRTVSTWHKYKEIREIHEDIEHVDGNTEDLLRSPAIRRLVICYTFIAVVMAIFTLTTFFCFYFFAHLGWTVLSNNFTLVIITVTTALMGERMGKEVTLAREDQHKAVIYESILLLSEISSAKPGPTKDKLVENSERFCRALRDTDMFVQPEYIQVPEKFKPQWDVLTSMQMFSTV